MEGSILWSQSDYDEREEFARAVKISLLGVTPIAGAASFKPRKSSVDEDWADWCDSTFERITGPVFHDTYNLAAELKLREIAAIDQKLTVQLGETSPGLIAASRPFIEGKEQMRGHREWRKYVLKLESGDAPGHLPVMFALHSAMFRLPLTLALQSYAWLEWKTGHHAIDKSRSAGYPDEPPPLFLEVKPHISRIINPPREEDDLESGLRVV